MVFFHRQLNHPLSVLIKEFQLFCSARGLFKLGVGLLVFGICSAPSKTISSPLTHSFLGFVKAQLGIVMVNVHARHFSFVAQVGLSKFDYYLFGLGMLQSWASHTISTPQFKSTLHHKINNLEFSIVVLGNPVQQHLSLWSSTLDFKVVEKNSTHHAQFRTLMFVSHLLGHLS
ncbi:hypothetical protein U1Q18_024239 [Sarracenia purpurea var. burkii]